MTEAIIKMLPKCHDILMIFYKPFFLKSFPSNDAELSVPDLRFTISIKYCETSQPMTGGFRKMKIGKKMNKPVF